MLEHLDSINWSSLTGAYGSAKDVPVKIRALASDDEHVRASALDELFGTVWHQGTVYSASAYVVPFLIELLAAQEVKDKPSIIALLASIAGGRGYYEVHERLFESLPKWRPPPDMEAAKKEEVRAVNAVRQAVSPILPDMLQHLRHSEPEVRLSVAQALPFYPEHGVTSKLALEQARASESNEEVLQAFDDALEALSQST